MIKINLANEEELRQKHLDNLKPEVQKKLEEKIALEQDSNLGNFLKFLNEEIDVLLCGTPSELISKIKYIEENYFISEKKMTNILSRRESAQNLKKDEKFTLLTKFAQEEHLFNHLSEGAFFTVKQFEEEVNSLHKEGGKWGSYLETLKEIFNYNAFSENKDGWGAYQLVTDLDISVCPYCNRSYITTLLRVEDDDKQTRPELDHYYPKSRYPYLALSFYNLIPSCSTYNGSFKGVVDFYEENAIHPYQEEFLGAATFKTDFNKKEPYDYRYLLGLSKDFKIILDINTKNEDLKGKINKTIYTFGLDRLYNTHQDFVRDLIRNGIVNNKSRIDEIYDKFGDLFNNRDEVLQSVFLNYVNDQDLGKRPLAKLTQDICKELGLLETQIDKDS
ncbi:hypothetical protein [Priestia aryabhattai]|uniref:hypothetical protein n=1 Tax=Priestia aryabhattai TaxID=412384 RepID=UPI003CA92726